MLKTTIAAGIAMAACLNADGESVLNEEQKVSQTFGHLIGNNLETPGLTFDADLVIQGIRDAVSGKVAPMNEEEYEAAMAQIQESAFSELANKNLKEATEYLANNESKEGIVAIESGKLQYEVLNGGEGESVAEHATPTIHYVGTYADGTVFGASEESSGPVTLPLDQTISGFSKGIVGMKQGEKRRLYIHPELGYGTEGHLPPNSLLIFDVEVVSVDATQQNAEESVEATIAEVNDFTDATVR